MPTIVCPTCGERLDVPPELAATAVRCGACESVIDPPPPPQSLPRSAETALPRARRVPAHRLDDDGPPPRRKGSRLWLVAALGLIGLSCAGCGGVIAFVGWKMEHPTWTRFAPPDGKFEVEFPGGPPKRVTQPVPVPGQMAQTMTMHVVERDFGREAYLVGYYDLPPGFDQLDEDDVEQALDAGFDNMRNLPDGGRVRETRRTHITLPNGQKGKEMVGTFTSPQVATGRVTVRMAVLDDRLYMLIALGHGDGPDQAKIDRFFGSFAPAKK